MPPPIINIQTFCSNALFWLSFTIASLYAVVELSIHFQQSVTSTSALIAPVSLVTVRDSHQSRYSHRPNCRRQCQRRQGEDQKTWLNHQLAPFCNRFFVNLQWIWYLKNSFRLEAGQQSYFILWHPGASASRRLPIQALSHLG